MFGHFHTNPPIWNFFHRTNHATVQLSTGQRKKVNKSGSYSKQRGSGLVVHGLVAESFRNRNAAQLHPAPRFGSTMSRLINRLANTLRTLESYLFGGNGFPPGALALVHVHDGSPQPAAPRAAPFSLRDLLGDGMLWAVPKHRRTVEKRLKRKYGSPEYKLKILTPKVHLRTCATCGSDQEVGVLCPTCYKKVRTETELMQEKIQSELGLEPVDRDVVVLYDRERDEQPAEFWQGKRIVEMEKPRPSWFSKNLLQKSTQQQQQSEPDELKPGHEKLG